MYTISLVLALIAATFLSAFSLAPLLQPAPVEAQFAFEEPPAAPEEGQGGVEQSVERQQQSSSQGGGAAEPDEDDFEPDAEEVIEICVEGNIQECVNQFGAASAN